MLSIVFNSVVFFLSTFQPLKVLWFHSFVEEQLSFTSSLPLPFLSGVILDLGERLLGNAVISKISLRTRKIYLGDA